MRLTSAVFGKTNDHHVIWNGKLLPGRVYFHSDPTDTRKNHAERPHSQSETSREETSMMDTVWLFPRKPGGSILGA